MLAATHYHVKHFVCIPFAGAQAYNDLDLPPSLMVQRALGGGVNQAVIFCFKLLFFLQ